MESKNKKHYVFDEIYYFSSYLKKSCYSLVVFDKNSHQDYYDFPIPNEEIVFTKIIIDKLYAFTNNSIYSYNFIPPKENFSNISLYDHFIFRNSPILSSLFFK